MKITVIKPEKDEKKIKNVAAYARVSTLSIEQEESYESQVAYYSQMLSRNKNYNFVGVYADQGVSGTQMKTRPNFVKMIDDAMAGKIDIIYCKSISRFSRNAAECQETVRMLKTKLVEVIFEKEQLSSFNPMSEMVFNFMTIIAQEESRSISENITWALDRLAEKGIRKFGKRAIFGYDEVDGVLIPNVYAIAVKMVFEEYAAGTPAAKIAEYLSQMGCVTSVKGKQFNSSDIVRIIENVIYKGDRIIQKKPHPNYLTKKPDYTREFTQYFIDDAHEPIVSKELWEACQKERKKRIKENHRGIPKEKLPVRVRGSSHPLYGKIICKECGSPYERTKMKTKGQTFRMWRCKKRNGPCDSHYVYEDEILNVVGENDFSQVEKIFIDKNKGIEVTFVKRYEKLNVTQK